MIMETPVLNQHNKLEHEQSHSCEHILNATMVRMFGCPRSRNAHIERKKSKCDYILDSEPSEDMVSQIENAVNEVIDRGLDVTVEYVGRTVSMVSLQSLTLLQTFLSTATSLLLM